MCGIFGFINNDSALAADEALLRQMAVSIKHRGPDEQKFFSLGNVGLGAVRLSIIDPQQGSQPLTNENSDIWACQNGEIYNYQELKTKLTSQGHNFQTNSDTEILPHLYEEKGEGFVKALRGMFAVAIWDRKTQKLILVRDRLGIKPLYYTYNKRGFYFASELKAILVGTIDRTINRQALGDYLALNYIPREQTIFSNIYKLLPGEMLVVDAAMKKFKVTKRLYWDIPEGNQNRMITNEREAKTRLHRRLDEAVKAHLVSDVPVGAFLSGGLDSSVVIALASRHVDKLKTFSVGFKEKSYDELNYARSVARRYHTDHHEIQVDLSHPDCIKEIIENFDEPFADSSALAVHAVSKFAAQSVKTVLSGDGGDEIFGGYTIYHADRLLKLYRHFPAFFKRRVFPNLARLLPASHKKTTWEFKIKRFLRGGAADPVTAHFLWRAILTQEQKHEVLTASGSDLAPTVRHWHELFEERQLGDQLNNFMYLDTKINLVDDMLTKVDRTSMANSLEVRVPLLDHLLVEFMSQIPSTMKIKRNKLKYILKEVSKDILPPEVINRPKAGFQVPVAIWLKKELRDLAGEYFSASKVKEQGYFNPIVVQKLYQDHCDGRRDYNRELWGLLCFGIWYDKWAK
ncbi:asparagine synthase (glutamine-hydrolyzing) [Patescibacteria group bacterium]